MRSDTGVLTSYPSNQKGVGAAGTVTAQNAFTMSLGASPGDYVMTSAVYDENGFIVQAESGQAKRDDLLQKVTVRRLRRWIARSGLRCVREDLYVTGFFRRALPGALRRRLAETPGFQDVMIGNIQCVLERQ